MKILVTGATGFIGKEIVSKLVFNNHQVIGIARDSIDKQHEIGTKIELIKTDITNNDDVLKLLNLKNIDSVIHCAGLAHQFGKVEAGIFEKVNVEGTENIARLAGKLNINHFILISSTAVYGRHKNEVKETTECRPETDYAKSKLISEEVCREVCEKNDTPLTIFRLAPVLGEKGIGNVPRLIGAINKRRFLWIGDGSNKKSLIYVEDVADACLKLLISKKNKTEIFNLASEPIEMRKLVSIISESLKKTVPKASIPVIIPDIIFKLNSKILKSGFIENLSKTIEKWLSDDIYSADKIKIEYGFQPETSVEMAVNKQCQWFLNKTKE